MSGFRASKIMIDGIYAEDFGVYLKERPNIPTPLQDVDHINVKGRHGSLTRKYNYLDTELFVNFHMYDEGDGFKKVFRKAKHRLLNAKTLIFDDDPSVFYKVKSVTIDESPTILFKYGEIPTTFRLDPFQYEVDNPTETITSRTTITNEGYESEPIMTVHCNGTGNIYINNQEVTIQNINGTITIDSEMQNAYRIENGYVVNLNSHMIGRFPVLKHGQNTISFDGDITKLEIICNKRWV